MKKMIRPAQSLPSRPRRRGVLLLAAWMMGALLANHAAAVDGPAAPVVITPADPFSIQRGIDEAAKSGAARVVIPPGVYRIPSQTDPALGPWSLAFKNLHDLEIDATGVTLIVLDPDKRGIQFKSCHNVTLRGVTLQRAVPPGTQAVIEAVDPAGQFIDVRVDKGYPSEFENLKRFDTMWPALFSADRHRVVAALRSFSPPRFQRLDDAGLIRITLYDKLANVPVPVTPGMHIAWRRHEQDDIQPVDCGGMKFINVTVAGGSGMVFHEMGGDGGNLYSHCKVTYGPRPEGATEDPLFATSADGLHSHDMVKGPIVEDCLFEGINDDAIAIHGTYAMAAEAGNKRLVAWVLHDTRDHAFCRPGETLRFYNKAGALAGAATVTAVKGLPGYKPTLKPESVYRAFQEPDKDFFVEVLLDKEVPGDFVGGLIANANRVGSGYVIRNCTIRRSSSRGVMAKGSDGLIEGNTFEDLGRAGVEFMSEMEVWSESDFATNVTVRNNTLRRVALNRQTGYLRHPGAITIFNFRAKTMDADLGKRVGAYVAAPGGHRNIVIEGNTIEDVYGPNLLITSAQDVAVRNNRFVRPMPIPTQLGSEKGVAMDALVWITQSTGVMFAGNQVIEAGTAMKRFVTATDTAQGQGFEDGFAQSDAGNPTKAGMALRANP